MKLKPVVLPRKKSAGRTYETNPWPALFEAFAATGDAVQEILDWEKDFKDAQSLYGSGMFYIKMHMGANSPLYIQRRDGRVFLVDKSKTKKGKKNGVGRSADLGTSYAWAGDSVL